MFLQSSCFLLLFSPQVTYVVKVTMDVYNFAIGVLACKVFFLFQNKETKNLGPD